jgi:hypothetical protein
MPTWVGPAWDLGPGGLTGSGSAHMVRTVLPTDVETPAAPSPFDCECILYCGFGRLLKMET